MVNLVVFQMKKFLLLILLVGIISVALGCTKDTGVQATGGVVAQGNPVELKYCDKQVPKAITERVCNQEPYECQKTCKEEKVIIENVPLNYIVERAEIQKMGGEQRILVSISNKDNVGGRFKVTFNIVKSDGKSIKEEIGAFIKPYELYYLHSEFYSIIPSWTYEITPPIKEKPIAKTVNTMCPAVCSRERCNNVEKIKYATEKAVC